MRGRREARGLVVLLLLAMAVVLPAYAAWLTFRPAGERITVAVAYPAQLASALLPPGLAWWRSRIESDRAMRMGMLFLAWGLAALASGQVVKTVCRALLDVPISPLSDVVILIGTALAVAGVLFLGGPAFGDSLLRRLLDGGIVAVAVLLLSWLTVMRTVYEAWRSDLLTLALAMAHPIAEVVPVVILISTLAHTRRPRPELRIGALATLLFIVGDGSYAYLLARGQHPDAPATDVAIVAGYLLLSVAALSGRDLPVFDEDQVATWQIVLPYVPLLGAGALIVLDMARGQPPDAFSQLLLVLVAALVLVRQLTAVVEAHRLSTRLNGAVTTLQRTLAEREILIEQAPVGICRLDSGGNVVDANRTLQAMLRCSQEEIRAGPILRFLHPDDRERDIAAYQDLAWGRLADDQVSLDSRLLRRDGTSLWCSQVTGVVRDPEGQVDGFISIVEDVTERRRQLERAAHIQRQLLPDAALDIPGYELAGVCLAAQDVAGDFYDWMALADGQVDISVADVMGKGVGAGLVMAVLRTALRSTPPELGPAARVSVAAESLALGLTDEGLFVTLFHARLSPDTGLLRYVDAGHGYCAIRRMGGGLARLGDRSLPVGVSDGEPPREGLGHLGPGDALLVYSDGLVEREDRTVDLEQVVAGLADCHDARAMVDRMLADMPPRPSDDVTVVVLRRLPEAGGDAFSPRSARS